jgi:hypothetical protein
VADGIPITAENLKQVLDRLDEVLSEAARLRKEVIRQLGEQRAGQQQHLSARPPVAARKRKSARRKH